jgi:hypothetical protein
MPERRIFRSWQIDALVDGLTEEIRIVEDGAK